MPHTIIGPTSRYQDQQQTLHSNISQDPNVLTYQSQTTLPMTDHYTQPISARALTSRLSSLQHQSQATNDNGGLGPHSQRRPRSSSLNSDIMPRFTKSATMSTTGTNDTQYSALRAEASCKTHRESVEVAQGEFSKPRVPERSRRDSSKSEEQKPFKYYGRHSNQWLFNDFSVTGAVSKGFKRVFGKESGKDWFEDREK
jgi:hypothetical protein